MRAVLASAILLAGCVTPPTTDPAPSTGATLDLPWELIECRFFNADIDVDPARLAERLPEGFELDASGSPLAPVTGGAPYLGVEAFSCADGSAWFSTYTSVIAPENLTPPDHLIFVMWDTLVDNATRRAELAARGLPVDNGTVTFAELAGPVPSSEVRIDLEALGTIVMTGVHARPGNPFGGDFVEYMEAEDGMLAAWSTHYEASTLAAGSAIIDLPSGSWLAEVAGGTRVEGNMITGTWSFTNGSIRMPVSNMTGT